MAYYERCKKELADLGMGNKYAMLEMKDGSAMVVSGNILQHGGRKEHAVYPSYESAFSAIVKANKTCTGIAAKC